MLLVAVSALLPFTIAKTPTYIGCFNDIGGGVKYPLLPAPNHRAQCYVGPISTSKEVFQLTFGLKDTCQPYHLVHHEVLYSGVKENPAYEPAECYCTGYFPGSDKLTDCTDETWNTVIDSAWYTWGCESKDAGLTPSPQGQYATPSECFDACSNMGPTEWTVMYSNGANGYYCWCTNGEGIPGDLDPRYCNSGSYFMYTKND